MVGNETGDRLRLLIYETGLSIADFALFAGMNRTTVYGYVRGQSEPSLRNLRILRRSLGSLLGRKVEWHELLGR